MCAFRRSIFSPQQLGGEPVGCPLLAAAESEPGEVPDPVPQLDVDAPPESVSVGAAVEVKFEDWGAEHVLPVFSLRESQDYEQS